MKIRHWDIIGKQTYLIVAKFKDSQHRCYIEHGKTLV